MVKLQKPNPKTLNKGANKAKKSNNFKKDKLTEAQKAIPATNVTAKKEKLKLIEKVINEKPKLVSQKPTKNVDKNQKVAAVKTAPKEETILKKVNKKNKTKSHIKEPVVETKVAPKQVGKKTPKVTVDQKPLQLKGDKKDKKKKAAKASANGKKIDEVIIKGPGPAVKIASSAKGKKKKQSKSKTQKKTAVPATHIEAVPFDEDKFKAIVNLENIKKISEALKKMVEKEVNEKKNSIFEDFRYLLNVASFKIPNCPKRIVKLNLAHSLVNPLEDDVVIIVPDLQRGAKMDYEPTIQHYEDLLRKNGVTGLKIVPFNQLRQECTTFEAKRKFASTYDHFLCDGRIVSHVVGFGGTSFQRTRTTFHAVHLNKETNYKRSVEKALKRTAFKQLQKGDLISIPVGNHRFTTDQLADNIKMIVDQLESVYPGGLGNIRNMHVKIDITGTSSLPIYASLAAAPAETPNVIGMREERMLKLKKEANEVLSQFNMSKTGEFVKLTKPQAERKRKIQEARKALLTTEGLPVSVESEDGEETTVPTKKSKKSKGEEEPQASVEEENEADEVESEEGDSDEEGNDDDDDDEDDDNDDDDNDDADSDDED